MDLCGSCSVRDSLLLVNQSEVLCWRWHSGSLGWCRNISPDPLSALCPTHEMTVSSSAVTSYHLVRFPLPSWLHCPPSTSCSLHTTGTCYCLFLVNSATFSTLLESFHSFSKSQTPIQCLTSPPPVFYFPDKQNKLWLFISHLVSVFIHSQQFAMQIEAPQTYSPCIPPLQKHLCLKMIF